MPRPLATEPGFALPAKDRIKEALHDALGSTADWPGRSGRARPRWNCSGALAADAPAALLEAKFWSGDLCHAARPMALGPVIFVDTTWPADIRALAAGVRRLLSAGQSDPVGWRGDEPVPA